MSRWLLVALVACGHATTPAPIPAAPSPTVLRLRAPPALDPDVRGAAYLSAVALQLQPGWSQFLDDCRLRLAATHPLNDMALNATAEVGVDARGQIVDVKIVSSGNTDFDRAVRDALRDANPLPAPPRELWSDDDRVHLAWMFARDRRQAGPATAKVIDVDLPLEGVVARLVRERELSRAARRIRRAPAGPERDAATRVLALAALREGLESSDSMVRRSAVDAIGRAGVADLAPDVRAMLGTTTDRALRLTAMRTVAALHDEPAAPVVLELLRRDVTESEQLARAEGEAIAALGHEADAAAFLRGALDAKTPEPNPIALAVLAVVPLPELTKQIGTWLAHKSARTRAAACEALSGVAPGAAKPLLLRGMGDRDANVRAACAGAVREPQSVRTKLRALVRDRDIATRAAAIAVLARLGDEKLDVSDDPASQVRAALAAGAPPASPAVLELLNDRDPDVRAAAWATYSRGDSQDRADRAKDAVDDPSPDVRGAVVAVLDDDDILDRLARADVDGDVRTDALVRYATRRGRTAMADSLLASFASATPGTSERVRTMLAWLLAR